MMDGRGKSDSPVVPGKLLNQAEEPAAEAAEGRGLGKGNSPERNALRTQRRDSALSALEQVRQAAREVRKQRFTALPHHVYAVERLRAAYFALKREAAAGIDGETWRHYGENLDGNLQDLSSRLQRGAYRAKPVRRAYIPKTDGRVRPLGVPTVEDKIVQRAVVEVLSAIYETDCLGFSYGFRPGRGPHDALDALSVGIWRKKVNWVLDADIRDFFGQLDRSWLRKFLGHRIADKRVLRLVDKWLAAGVIEDGRWSETPQGSPQGASVSPLLANVYLHYVLDLWADWRRRHVARGEVIIVRFADDFVMGFEEYQDACRFLHDLRERFAKFGLELHPGKTRLIEFGRFAAANRQKRGAGKPETFDFLGFTHICAKMREGRFWVRRITVSKRMRAKLAEVKDQLRQGRHQPVPEQGRWLGSVVRGHCAYYAVPGNRKAVAAFRTQVTRHWQAELRRRSQRSRLDWKRMNRLATRWLPPARVMHPFPDVRFGVRTRGRSPVR